MTLGYTSKLGLKICLTYIKTQKIDDSTIKTFKIVLANFQIKDKFKRAKVFQKTFLLADFDIKMVLRIAFLILSNINI